MKTKKIFSVMLCGAMFAFTACETNDLGEQPDGAVKIDGHYAVDLGLPSGTLWATCNVGATAPEEYGDYFAWGETEPKEEYIFYKDGEYYKWGTYDDSDTENYGMTKYNKTDGKTVLDPEDDAAHVNWGGDWRMPTRAEIEELLDSTNCTQEWTDNYNGTGVAGYIVTSVSNGKSIFAPAAGYRNSSFFCNVAHNGYYWSSSLDSRYPYYAYNLYFRILGIEDWDNYERGYGRSVRPVCSPK